MIFSGTIREKIALFKDHSFKDHHHVAAGNTTFRYCKGLKLFGPFVLAYAIHREYGLDRRVSLALAKYEQWIVHEQLVTLSDL